MSNLETHARKELEIAGLFKEGSAYDGMLADGMMKLIKVFADEGHSGMSASMTVQIFEKLARFEPLTPLTGEDSEWNEVADGVFQNNRCSRVFKENGKAYDIQGKVFREPDGGCYTSGDSRTDVEFPYVPKTEYVDVEAEENNGA